MLKRTKDIVDNVIDLKHKYYELERSVDLLATLNKNLSEQNKQRDEAIESLKRIVANYIPGKITYSCNNKKYGDDDYYVGYCFEDHWTHIYKDGKEFIIEELELCEPTFKDGNTNDTILVDDITNTIPGDDKIHQKKVVSYVIDLNNCTFIQTK